MLVMLMIREYTVYESFTCWYER